MKVSYKKLWHMLIELDMKKQDLQHLAKVSPATIAKLSRGDNLNTDSLAKICKALKCDVSDIMEFIPESDDEDETQKDV
jgi:DNA-binding Xre family transcriptional regulator